MDPEQCGSQRGVSVVGLLADVDPWLKRRTTEDPFDTRIHGCDRSSQGVTVPEIQQRHANELIAFPPVRICPLHHILRPANCRFESVKVSYIISRPYIRVTLLHPAEPPRSSPLSTALRLEPG